MSRVSDAKRILRALGLPPKQQNDNAAYTLLAFSNVGPGDNWSDAAPVRNKPHGVIEFAEAYGKKYAENTRETIRRQAIHQFIQAGVLVRNPDDPSLPTNSPRTHYALSEEALNVIRSFGTSEFGPKALTFRAGSAGGLAERYARRRTAETIPVTLPDGATLTLSPGRHNDLQRAIVESFLPTFAPGATVLYLGDTDKKSLHVENVALDAIGVPMSAHDKLPDVVAHDTTRSWLFLCEAVTSHGPVSPKRYFELEADLRNCSANRVYVSAFPDFKVFKKHLENIAWETEVWIAEMPTHLLHFDGESFISPTR